jgi:hypothetical protein
MNAPTLQQLTPPGFLNYSPSANEKTQKIIALFDAVFQARAAQVNLYDSIFRLWQSRDYSGDETGRNAWLADLAQNCGLSWFIGTNSQLAGLTTTAERGWSANDTANFLYILNQFAAAPFFWVSPGVAFQIVYGTQRPAVFAENFIIFSNSVSLPATPSPITYTPRAWSAPAGWTLQPSSSTYFCRGYISGETIVWSAPLLTTGNFGSSQYASVAGLPGSATTGALGFVQDDTTGDVGSIYYYDGTQWRKNSATNENQGSIAAIGPDIAGPRAVYAPNPDTSATLITSERQPPVDGPSQGYGMYGGYAIQTVASNQVDVAFDLTADGESNLNVIIYFFRRLKPAKSSLSLSFTVDGDEYSARKIFIKDTGDL